MTIDEAIEQFKYDAEYNRADLDLSYAEDNEQLAEWLEELKSYRASVFSGDMTQKMLKEEYNKAIDDFVKEICKMIVQSENNGNYRFYAVEIKQAIADLAEQLKAGEVNE